MTMRHHAPDDPLARARRYAVAAESLYLANLLIAPGLGFLGLLWLWRRPAVRDPQDTAMALARQHLLQTLVASLWAGALLIGLSALLFFIGGLSSPVSWLTVILFFIVFHSTLVLCGMVGLARAMVGQPFRFPLIGPPDPS